MIGGMDKPSKVMSSEYDIVYVQEAIELSRDDWEALLSRLRYGKVSFQQIIADTNPDRPTHWLKQRCDEGACKILYSTHQDNPLFYDDEGKVTQKGKEYVEGVLGSLTGVRYQRLTSGLWVAAEGIIYEEWNPAVHLVNSFEIPEGWERYVSIDFGFIHPFVAQWWAEDPDGKLYLYREIFQTRRRVEQHAKEILRLNGKERITKYITDHDAENRSVLEKELGQRTQPAHKKVKEGIEVVQKRLAEKRIFFFRDALVTKDRDLSQSKKPTSTVEEISGYVWDEKKEEPVKQEDDGMDAMRYLVAARDLKRREVKLREDLHW